MMDTFFIIYFCYISRNRNDIIILYNDVWYLIIDFFIIYIIYYMLSVIY